LGFGDDGVCVVVIAGEFGRVDVEVELFVGKSGGDENVLREGWKMLSLKKQDEVGCSPPPKDQIKLFTEERVISASLPETKSANRSYEETQRTREALMFITETLRQSKRGEVADEVLPTAHSQPKF